MVQNRIVIALFMGVLLTPGRSNAGPPTAIAPRGATAETVIQSGVPRMTLEGGYAHRQEGWHDGNFVGTNERVPLTLRTRVNPQFELRSGAVTWRPSGTEEWFTAFDVGVLLAFSTASPDAPGLGMLGRIGGQMGDTPGPFFGDTEFRFVASWILIPGLLLDVNLGYWFGAGGGGTCTLSEQGTYCTSIPKHFIPAMIALRVNLREWVSLYAETTNYLSLEQFGDASIQDFGVGATFRVAPRLALDVGLTSGIRPESSLGFVAGFSWDLVRL